jgi:transglutaminase-like putative cysteine protease
MPLGFAPSLRPLFQKAPAAPRPSLMLFFWLTGAFLLTLLPQIGELPIWISIVVVVALVIRAWIEIYRLRLPSTTFTSLLALCLLAAIYLQLGSFFGRESETALMAGLMAIKFYELRGPRDVSVIIFSSFFIVMSALLYSQALELFVYCLIMMWLLTAVLLRNNMGDNPDNHLLPMLGQAGIVFIQALPLTLFLFFLFPRYTGKLQIPLNDAQLGITDKVEPGSISRLAQNDSVAMYVRFTPPGSTIPSPKTMYWRALVLWDYRDGIWTAGQMGRVPDPIPVVEDSNSMQFTEQITVLPDNQRWLFALDYPISPATNLSVSELWSKSLFLRGGVLQLAATDMPINHTERYSVKSAYQLAPLPEMLPGEADFGRKLPERKDFDPRVVALADKLYAVNPNPEAYVMTVLHYFHHEGFRYTTSPGSTPPGRDWLSYFLFTAKAGYCEHFASAFAVLMRLKQVPARLVVGYQGAEYNPYDDVYTVRQSNAHAWDEVWLEAKKRWWRIDPTSVLPPGLPDFAPPGSTASEDNQPMETIPRPLSFAESYLPDWASRALSELEMRRQQLEVGWDDWVFSYNPNDTQTRLAKALGFGKPALALLSVAAILFCFLIFRHFMRRRALVPPIENLYAKFCRYMAQRGIPRAKWEGPLAYTERVAEAFPEKREAIQHVGEIVASFRYGPCPGEPPTPGEVQRLLAEITPSQAPASSADE